MSYLELFRLAAPETIIVLVALAVLAVDLVAGRGLDVRYRFIISGMVAVVGCALAVAVLSFVIPGTPADSDLSLANNTYSAEEVILNQNEVADTQKDQVSDAQVLTTLYGSEEEK